MRQRQIDEAADEAGAVHLGRLLLLAVERLQRGQQDQRREGQPLPGDDEDDRKQRILREPVDRLHAEEAGDVGEHAVARMHDHVLPHQRGDRRHDEEGRDDQDAHDALAPHRLVEQQRQQDAADDGDQQHADHDDQRVDDRLEEGGIGDRTAVVGEADEAVADRVEQIVVLEREPQRDMPAARSSRRSSRITDGAIMKRASDRVCRVAIVASLIRTASDLPGVASFAASARRLRSRRAGVSAVRAHASRRDSTVRNRWPPGGTGRPGTGRMPYWM